jgi:hypothetical protein
VLRKIVGLDVLTTMMASEATLDVTAKGWHRVREAMYDGRKADRNKEGVSLDAIVTMMERNGFRRWRVLFRRHFGVFRWDRSDWLKGFVQNWSARSSSRDLDNEYHNHHMNMISITLFYYYKVP